jgi:hypothetical protein
LAKTGKIIDDFSLPYWNWNYITPNGTNYPTGMTTSISHMKYESFFFDVKNPAKGLDDTSNRYASSMFGDFQASYTN